MEHSEYLEKLENALYEMEITQLDKFCNTNDITKKSVRYIGMNFILKIILGTFDKELVNWAASRFGTFKSERKYITELINTKILTYLDSNLDEKTEIKSFVKHVIKTFNLSIEKLQYKACDNIFDLDGYIVNPKETKKAWYDILDIKLEME